MYLPEINLQHAAQRRQLLEARATNDRVIGRARALVQRFSTSR